jgi:hypothetical protein
MLWHHIDAEAALPRVLCWPWGPGRALTRPIRRSQAFRSYIRCRWRPAETRNSSDHTYGRACFARPGLDADPGSVDDDEAVVGPSGCRRVPAASCSSTWMARWSWEQVPRSCRARKPVSGALTCDSVRGRSRGSCDASAHERFVGLPAVAPGATDVDPARPRRRSQRRRTPGPSPSSRGAAPPGTSPRPRTSRPGGAGRLSRLLPRRRWAAFFVTPATLLRHHLLPPTHRLIQLASILGKPGQPDLGLSRAPAYGVRAGRRLVFGSDLNQNS